MPKLHEKQYVFQSCSVLYSSKISIRLLVPVMSIFDVPHRIESFPNTIYVNNLRKNNTQSEYIF